LRKNKAERLGNEKYRNNPHSEDELRTTMFREAPTETIAMGREICRIEIGTVCIRQDNLSEKQITDGGASLKKLKIRGNIFFCSEAVEQALVGMIERCEQ